MPVCRASSKSVHDVHCWSRARIRSRPQVGEPDLRPLRGAGRGGRWNGYFVAAYAIEFPGNEDFDNPGDEEYEDVY